MNEKIQEGQFEDITNTSNNKIEDWLGIVAGAIILTLIAAALLRLFFTIIPTIKFNFILILKCWAGIWGLMFARGALKNKMI